MKKNIKWIIIGILVIAIIGAVISQKEEEEKEANRKKDFTQNETATYKDVEYSIVKVEKTKGTNEYFQAKDGYEYVKITVKIENKSNEKISYNSIDWKLVNSDGAEDTFGAITAEKDVLLSSGNLDPQGKVEGVMIWEEKIGDNNLRLRYYNTIVDKEYTLQFKLD